MTEQLGGVAIKSAFYRNYLSDFHLYATLHRFFASMSQIGEQLEQDLVFDVSGLENDILACVSTENPDESQINARLSLWRQVLEKFDAELSVATLRHQFSQFGTPDSTTLEMVLSFYLSKTHKMETDRDKIDLVATRWGQLTFQIHTNETLLLAAPSLQARIEKIYQAFGLTPLDKQVMAETLKVLESERKRLLTIHSLSELIEEKILLQIRKLKNNLGELFFQPAVLSEVVALNINLHNTFQALFLAEHSRLNDFLQPEREHKISNADEMLVSVIERPSKVDENLAPINQHNSLPTPTKEPLDRTEILKAVQGMRTAISVLELHLQSLLERV